MTDYPWDAPARIVLSGELNLPLDMQAKEFDLAHAIQQVMERLPSDMRQAATITFPGGSLDASEFAVIYSSPQFPLKRSRDGNASGGKASPDKRAYRAA